MDNVRLEIEGATIISHKDIFFHEENSFVHVFTSLHLQLCGIYVKWNMEVNAAALILRGFSLIFALDERQTNKCNA